MSKKVNIQVRRNIWGNINGFCRGRKIKWFGESSFDAKLWIEKAQAKGHCVKSEGLW